MADIIDPLEFCAVPTLAIGGNASVTIVLPFGLPEAEIDTSTCEGVYLGIAQLSASVSFMIPIIKIVACILKLIELVEALVEFALAMVEALGPPPDPSVISAAITKITDKVAELGECKDFFISLNFAALPNPFCQMIYRMVLICIAVLTCIAQLLTIRAQNEEQIELLQASGDVALETMANCLIEQQKKLDKLTEAKLDGVKALITLLNALAVAVPPIPAAVPGVFPISVTSGGATSPPEDILEAIAYLQVIVDNEAFKACAGEVLCSSSEQT